MKINRNNYEAYFIDYLEDNLDENIVDDFIEFLQQNPDLKEELSVLGTVSAVPEKVSFSKKNSLYREKFDSEREFEKAAIANLENDISATDKDEFERYIANHPHKKRDVVLFSQTKLQPDETIVFSNKKRLYHYLVHRTILLWTARIAAILILAFAFFTLTDEPTNNFDTGNKIAKLEKETELVKKKTTPPKLKNTTEKTEKKIPVRTEKSEAKPPVKKVVPAPKQKGSLRENSRRRVEYEEVAAAERTPLKIPDELKPITASVTTRQPKTNLAVMYLSAPENYDDERLLADVIKEKTGLDKFRFDKITKAGLKFVSNISNEKFNYETNDEGKVVKYNYDSRILAFSIPTKNESAE